LKTIRSSGLLALFGVLTLAFTAKQAAALPAIIIRSARCDGPFLGKTTLKLVLDPATAANNYGTLYLYYRAASTCCWQTVGIPPNASHTGWDIPGVLSTTIEIELATGSTGATGSSGSGPNQSIMTVAPCPTEVILKANDQGPKATYQLPCHCPPGWLDNTTNVDGGGTRDGKCKKKVGIWDASMFPTGLLGRWGFTVGNELWAWGTIANGGANICH
jgi:hypothetical protein